MKGEERIRMKSVEPTFENASVRMSLSIPEGYDIDEIDGAIKGIVKDTVNVGYFERGVGKGLVSYMQPTEKEIGEIGLLMRNYGKTPMTKTTGI